VRDDFNPQAIANTLWAFAMLGQQPSKEIMAGMMKQAVAVRNDFNPQDIANTDYIRSGRVTLPAVLPKVHHLPKPKTTLRVN